MTEIFKTGKSDGEALLNNGAAMKDDLIKEAEKKVRELQSGQGAINVSKTMRALIDQLSAKDAELKQTDDLLDRYSTKYKELKARNEALEKVVEAVNEAVFDMSTPELSEKVFTVHKAIKRIKESE